jgi:AcrR family transcriptional regulator
MATRARTKQANGRKRQAATAEAPTRVRDAEVLETAAEVFARRGYAAATVQDVADDLGMLKGSIYYYIKSKEDLLFRLLNAVHDDVDALLQEVVALPELDPLERLCEYVRRQLTYNLRNLVRISVYYNDIDQLSDDRRKTILRRRKTHEDFVVNLVLEAQRDKLIDETREARLLAYNVFAILIWPYRWFKPRGHIKPEDAVEECVAFVRGGLTAS